MYSILGRVVQMDGRVTRFTPAVIPLHHIIQIFHLPDDDVGPVLLGVALDGGFIGVTAINPDRLRDPVAADRLGQNPERRCFIPVLREQEVNGLAVLIHRPIPITPLSLDPNIRFLHPPADPDGPLAAVERRLQLRAVLDDPPVDGRMIHVDPAFKHQFFDMARAQRIRHIPADTGQNDCLREVGTLETHGHRRSPSLVTMSRGRDHTPNHLK